MERLILPLENGVTGVVGPNGCGKSNIVDALRWVLGETNARSLRGGLLEDVIFNGTDKLRPLGLAEVTLTLKSESESLYKDIATGSKEGELQAQLEIAESQIQQVSAKLKELTKENTEKEIREEEIREESPVTEDSDHSSGALTEQTSGTKPHLRVISSDESVSDLPVSSESVSDDESNSVQDLTLEHSQPVSQAVLDQKYGWLKGSSEVQVTRRLYRSGESEYFLNQTPCRLRDLKEFFRIVGLSARTFTIVAQGEVSRIVTAKPDQRRKIFEEAAGVLGLRDKIAAAERRLKDTADNVARLEDIEKEVSRQVSGLKRQANRAKRREGLKAELLECEVSVLTERMRRSVKKQSTLQTSHGLEKERENELLQIHQESSAKEESLRSELLQAEIQSEELRANLDTLRDAVNERGRKEESFRSRINELTAIREAKATETSRTSERVSVLNERKLASEKLLEDLTKEEAQLKEKLNDIDSELEKRLKQHETNVEQAKTKVLEEEKRVQSLREEISLISGELIATRKQLHADSLYDLLESEGGNEFAKLVEDIHGEAPKLLAEYLDIDPSYVTAVQVALGKRASFFVVEKAAELAKGFREEQLKSDKEQLKQFWFGLLKTTESAQSLNTDNSVESLSQLGLVPLTDFVTTQRSEIAELISKLLFNVYFTPSYDDALNLLERGSIPKGVTLITKNGEMFSEYSCVTPRKQHGILDIKQHLSDIERKESTLRSELAEFEKALNVKKEELVANERKFLSAKDEKKQKDQLLIDITNNIGTVQGKLDAEKRVLSEVKEDLTDTESQQRELLGVLSTLENQGAETNSSLELLLQDDHSKIADEVSVVRDKLQGKDEIRKELRKQYDNLRSSSESEWRTLEDTRQKVSSLELDIEKVRLEQEHILHSAQERLPESEFTTVSNLPTRGDVDDLSVIDDSQFEELEERATAIRSQLHREGEVDPNSIEEFERESSRLEELVAQKKDLTEASRTLQKTVDMLREQSVTRFVATFEKVKEHFVALMPRLFGGGKADLSLSNPDDPLEAGIEVTLRPPGKKPKSLDLLSGGEKALTATALIISLFLVRPSPLCVLDEVDAPLDEANLVRFLSLVKEMSAHTQFMVITHNKASMTAADRLVGVTMQKPGASTVLTVSLDEAYEHVA